MLVDPKDYAAYGLDPADASLERRLAAVELKLRKIANNGFNVRSARAEAASVGGDLAGRSPLWGAGDTVQVLSPDYNAGLYVVESVGEGGRTVFDRPLIDAPLNRAVLVRYPDDVVEGALGMLEYDRRMGGKSGIASESLSRRSVTYDKPSGDGARDGYPAEVTAFLRPYKRARC